MRAWVLALSCAGCSSILGIDNFKLGDAGTTDASIDGMSLDAAPGCLGPDGFFICDVAPTAPITIDTAAQSGLNTDTDGRCATAAMQPASWPATQPAACFVIATTINVNVMFRATGTRPLVLVATDSITVKSGAAIDVAGHRTQFTPVPGAPSTTCVPPQPAGDGTPTLMGGGGGAGASFMTRGGNGGPGGNGTAPGIAASTTTAAPSILRGGCNGGDGGRPPSGGPAARGGFGGGAVYLVAKNKITIEGAVNASGAGGMNGLENGAGGAGAGAGGMIVLHAPMIGGNGAVVANGGGGANGAAGASGMSGNDPDPTQPFVPAMGGLGSPAEGGAGFAGTVQAKPGLQSTAFQGGGGGGGGGGGYIRANVSTASTLRISPPISLVP